MALKKRLLHGVMAGLAISGMEIAQAETVDTPRPKTALVLSGGGARGLAHVGVVNALDKLRIPYDCIAGTSMGAIAGGTYASGTSPQRAEQLVTEADWPAVFADRSKRSDVPYFRKYEDYKPYFDFTLTLDGLTLKAPRNFVGVQHIGLFFRELAGADVVDDFSKLPIPFRAVGTDLVTGEPVIIKDGSLVEAMRASMSIPGMFPPINYRGHLLVDGSLSMNLPVSIGRELCGESARVIAVNVSTPGYQKDELVSFFTIGEQVVTNAMQPNMRQQLSLLRKDDVLITPYLNGYTASDFVRVRDLVKIGEAAVLNNESALKGFQVSEAAYEEWKADIAAKKKPVPFVDDIHVVGTRWVNQEVLQDLLKVEKGNRFDMGALHKNISRVYARGDFSSLSYDLKKNYSGGTDIILQPEEKDGRDFVRFGLGLYSDFEGNSHFSAIASLRRAWLNRLDAEWRTDVWFGRDYGFQSEWYQPASLGSEFFVSPYIKYQMHYQDVYTAGLTKQEYQFQEKGGGLEIGSVFGRWGEMRLGLLRTQGESSVISMITLPNKKVQKAGYTFRSTYDQLDDTRFPKKGASAHMDYYHSVDDMGADEKYEKVSLKAIKAFTKGKTTILAALYYADDFNSTLPYYDNFSLGGMFNLSAYPSAFFQGGSLMYGSLVGYRRISELPSIVGRGIYGGVVLESGRMTHETSGFQKMNATGYSGGAYLAADTVAGPFYLMASIGNQHQAAIYMALGISF